MEIGYGTPSSIADFHLPKAPAPHLLRPLSECLMAGKTLKWSQMKIPRRLWFVLAPVLLMGTVVGVRQVVRKEAGSDWNETEAEFRRDVKVWTKDVPTIHVSAWNTKRKLPFEGEIWNTADFLSTVEGVRLVRGQTKLSEEDTLPDVLRNETMIVISLNQGGSVGAPEGFYLSLKEDRGWIDLPSQLGKDDWRGENWKNRGYELAPQTCQAMKKHLFSLEEKNGELVLPR